ncbi:MAG: CehA/McbA family metallohydrolase [Acidobacteriota bacterium]
MHLRIAALAVFSLAVLPGLAQTPPIGAGRQLGSAPLVIRKHFTPTDRAGSRYQYVPFEVPTGVSRMRISYTYNQEGGNTIELGLFEPGPLTFGTPAFRGWSGRERETIEIGEEWSSPGYRTGPVRQGQWNVALGLYRVGESGVDVTVIVQLNPPESLAPTPVSVNTRAASSTQTTTESGAAEWWHGDLHVHTEHSDGKHPVAEVAKLAVASGLDFIIVTDHNNTTHRRDLAGIRAPLVLSGEEVTTPGGDANVWGVGPDDWFDFRLMPGAPHLDDVVQGAHARGALFSINHPFISGDECAWTHAVPASLDALEVWNGPLGPQQEAVAMWEKLLQGGRHVTGVASSDWHHGPEAPIGAGSVRVFADSLAQAPLLDGIRKAHVIMMRDAAAPAPHVVARAAGRQAGVGDTLEVQSGETVTIDVAVDSFVSPGTAGCPEACRADLIVSTGRRISEPLGGGSATFTLQLPGDAYVRLEISAGSTILAMTNPIWLHAR